MSKNLCDLVDLYADDELRNQPSVEAEFRVHLNECGGCRAELAEILALDEMISRHLEADAARARPVTKLTRAGWALRAGLSSRSVMLAATVCLIAVVGVIAFIGLREPTLPIAVHGSRGVEFRLTDPTADVYRPFQRPSRRMGSGSPSPGRRGAGAEGERLDLHGQIALLAAEGDFDAAQRLLTASEGRNGQDAKVTNDLAAMLLSSGRDKELLEAFHRLDGLLRAQPTYPQALWNQALILDRLGMPLQAARFFDAVAKLGEQGWAEEAKARASRLREDTEKRYQRWKRTRDAGEELLRASRLPSAEVLGAPAPILRLYFYDAVRSRQSAADVKALHALAEALDQRAGDTVLARYVDRIAARDFATRAPLAATYAELLRGTLSASRTQAFLDALRSSREIDILLGALIHADANPAEIRRHGDVEVKASGKDPWLRALVEQHAAKALGHSSKAKQLLEEQLATCGDEILYRCLSIQLDLVQILLQRDELDRAFELALRGLRKARESSEWDKELGFIQLLDQVARFNNDTALERAYLEESLAHAHGDEDAAAVQRAHQNLAALELYLLNFDGARKEMDLALGSRSQLSLNGAYVLSDLSRLRSAPGDGARLEEALAKLQPGLSPGGRALATHIRGRFALAQEPAKGRALLEQAIREANAVLALRETSEDTNALRARAYSYTSLLFDAGRTGAFELALSLFGEEFGREVPSRCGVAITAETEWHLFVVRDARGMARGYFNGDARRITGGNVPGLLPAEAIQALLPCPTVEVRTRPPLQGLAKLLPPNIVWSIRLRPGDPPPAPVGPTLRLVVANVSYSKERLLKPLYWDTTVAPGGGEIVRTLERGEATPSAVLREMPWATEIELATHGLQSLASGEWFLVLSPDDRAGDDRASDVLTASQIRRKSRSGEPLLVKHPIVYLAACEVGNAGPVLHDRSSLPAAFLDAGARAVFAATEPLETGVAHGFFKDLQSRISEGATPAEALRDAREALRRTAALPRELESVMLFE